VEVLGRRYLRTARALSSSWTAWTSTPVWLIGIASQMRNQKCFSSGKIHEELRFAVDNFRVSFSVDTSSDVVSGTCTVH
jgi:hypothetical protein